MLKRLVPESCPDPTGVCRNASFSSLGAEKETRKGPRLTSQLLLCSGSLSLYTLQHESNR